MTPDTTEGSKKRKRDVEVPRITYIAASRTFDRLFKEDSLDGMKDVVRKKLGLSTSIPVYLSQIREGKSVDLEDDDDFEAFHSSAFSTVSTKVQVVLGEGSTPYTGNQTEPISVSARRKKKKKRNSDAFPVDSSNAGPSHNTAKDAHPSTNLRVAFTEPSSDPPTAPYKPTKKNAQKEFVHDASSEADQPTKKTIPPSGKVSDMITPEGTEIISEKERRKKIKKDRLATAPPIPEPASTTRTSDATETTRDTNTQRTTTDEVVKPAKKSTKRKRAESPSRAIEQTSTESQKIPATSNLDVPSNDGDTEDSRARKKSKKKISNHLNETPAGTSVPEQSKPAPPGPTTQSSQPVESPAERKSHKKEKAAVDSVKKFVAEPSHDKSDGTANAKKSMKARRKSEVQPLEPPDEGLSSTRAVQERQAEEPGLPEPTKPKGKSKKIAEPPTRSSKESNPDVQKGPPKKQSEKGAAQTMAPEAVPAPAKTPKKINKKKIEVKATDPSQPSQVDAPGEKSAAPQKTGADFKEVTKAAVQAILARKGVQSKPTIQATATPAPPVTTAPEEPPRPSESTGPAITEPTHVAAKEKNSQPEGTKDKATAEIAKCDVCEESPPHPRSKCAIIKAGIRSMRKRIVELQRDTPGGEDRSKVIAELQSLIEKKTRKPRASGVPKLDAPALEEANPPATHHVNDTPAEKKSTSKQSSTQTLHSTQPLTTTPKPTSLPAPSSQPPAPQSPLVTRRSPSLQPPPSAQPQPSKQVPSQNTAKNPKKPSTPHLKGPNVDDMSLGMTPLGFGDVSGYTEKDLQELVRGPKVSLADVPSSDPSEDENGQQEEAVLESDSVDVELPRNLSQTGYPDSSDEFDNEDDDDKEESPGVSTFPKLPLIQSSAARLSSGREVSSAADDTQRGNHSFLEVEALGSSRELDRTVDIVVNDIVDADLVLISPAKASQDRRNGGSVSSDTSTSNEAPETRLTSPEIPLVSKAIEKRQELDPIEPSENPQASQPELIVSDDEFHPVESTPKEEVAIRTRSQRNKAAAPTPTPVATQASQEPVENANESSKPTRKTRSLTKISELPVPVPPNPSVRIIRPPQAATTTVRTRRQMTQEESQEQEAPEPTPANGKSTPAAKTTAKPLSKAAAKPPTKPPMAPPPPKTVARKVPASAKSILTNGPHAGKTRGSKAAVVNGLLPEDTGPNTTTVENGEHPVISWVTLQESQASTETPGMLDELSSSPTLAPSLTKGQKAGVNGSSPLFVHADSQQSFPYSQYLDLSGKVPAASPNDSEDEDEVEATVVKPVTKFRSLTEIASQPPMFRRQSSQIASVTKGPVIDYYGTPAGHEESDESGSDSDSEAGGEKVASHIPASRRAGVAVSKRK